MTTTVERPAVLDRGDRYCVIGAGAAGLTAAKNLLEYGFDVDVLERADEVGGTWNYRGPSSAAYRSIHLITSKPFIEFSDFPIPRDYPTYLGQRHALAYLRSYAEHFGVLERIEFETTVTWVDREDGSPDWIVTLDGPDGTQVRRYAGLVIANGHNWSPRFPDHPGQFDGLILHSSDYKNPDVLRDKRVLVVGCGTSGCDIAVESGQNAEATFLSVRRGLYIWPKYIFGFPTDVFYEFLLKFRMPRPITRFFGKPLLRVNSVGPLTRYGLPKPEHKLLEEHFVLNSTLLYHLDHGDIGVKPEIAELCGDSVRFTDGTTERIDVIVYATGFRQAEFPFIDRKHLNWGDNIPRLHLHAYHPDYDNLYVIGYFQTSTGTWPIMENQAQAMARYLYLSRSAPQRVAKFRREKADPMLGAKLNGGIDFYDSERHWIQVEHVSFRRRMRKLAKRLFVPAPASARRAEKVPSH